MNTRHRSERSVRSKTVMGVELLIYEGKNNTTIYTTQAGNIIWDTGSTSDSSVRAALFAHATRSKGDLK